jgi:hypothetical protein
MIHGGCPDHCYVEWAISRDGHGEERRCHQIRLSDGMIGRRSGR